MLVLARRPGEAIVLDGGIRIVVVSADRRGVRLGIEAPEHVAVLREELVIEVATANVAANGGPGAVEWARRLSPGLAR